MVGVQEINSWVQASIGGGPGAMAASQEFNGSDAESQWVWAHETRGLGHRKMAGAQEKRLGPGIQWRGPSHPMAEAQEPNGFCPGNQWLGPPEQMFGVQENNWLGLRNQMVGSQEGWGCGPGISMAGAQETHCSAARNQ